MPLVKGASRNAIARNIAMESRTRPRDQAIAIALDVARRAKKASGGSISSPNYLQAVRDLNLTPQEQALYQRHLTNLNGSGGVDNVDGSRSTLFQTPLEHDGRFYNVPTVWDGKIEATFDPSGKFSGISKRGMSNIANTGIDSFPSYDSEDAAESRYQKMHQYMDKDTAQYFQNRSANMPTGDEIQPMRGGGRVARALQIARKANGGGVFTGYIPGSSGGRTDNKPINVASGSYVIPADILSGIGQGNSHAGADALHKIFGMGPYGINAKADGGSVGEPVPIVAASGEMVVPPDKVTNIGGGDLQRGHSILDALVKHVRKSTIKKLSKLPGPKAS